MAVSALKRILLAEDELPLSNALSAKLRLDGFDVTTAYNGPDTLKMLKDQKFDLILLDLMLPDVNGFQIMEKMQETGMTTPVIVTTVLSQPEDERRAMSLGAAEYLRKGDVSLSMISDRVKAHLAKK